MTLLFLPELFCLISINLCDKEKIFLVSCSKMIHNFKSLLILDSEYDLEEINDKWSVKNIFIKNFSLENKIKELIKDLVPESIIINFKYVKFVSNNTNIKLFHNEEIIKKLVFYECYYLAMKIMLNNDGSINNINKQFIKSLSYGYSSIVKLLIDLGADIGLNNNYPIIVASYCGHLVTVKLLIDCGADVTAQNNQAIINASLRGYLSVVKLLIGSGANIHDQNNDAVICASWRGHLSVVKLLIELGANIHAQNNQAIIDASSRGHLSVVKLLIASGADIHARNNLAIINASRYGHLQIVKLLIESGANVHAQNNLEAAKINNNLDIIELLRKN